MPEYKNAYQLELLIADQSGFDPKNIQVMKVGNSGDFRATFVGTAPGVNQARAKSDVESACSRLKVKYRLIS